MILLEQRKAEKNALREKKIVSCHIVLTMKWIERWFNFQQEKYMEIALAKEAKRIAEDLQLKDLKVWIEQRSSIHDHFPFRLCLL